jgi:hypothetical protein
MVTIIWERREYIIIHIQAHIVIIHIQTHTQFSFNSHIQTYIYNYIMSMHYIMHIKFIQLFQHIIFTLSYTPKVIQSY